MKNSLTIFALLLIGLFSCNNNTEEAGPLPTIDNYVVSPGHDHHALSETETIVIMGEEANIDADLAGTQLRTVVLDIHWGEGHEHSARVSGNEDRPQWTEKITWNFGVEGGLTPEGIFPNNHKLHQHIDVPTGVKEGEYHFVLHLWDVNGNEVQKALNVEVHEEGHEHAE
ncbi:DUF4625 domain-containing protein [Flammeovirga aprica]|uniref:DUF4625 domain-containing protein n=1 Tax=Flammeovirga aprica JL-4 TaxID=694437 RepID=A0A7X9S0Y1_9BACT|nr:DUF4625 domain-containing protein [Flammeovirga aprica]NME72319.1 DUF4625 domain-containing protein [Flammeovirga aprica JL-4]